MIKRILYVLIATVFVILVLLLASEMFIPDDLPLWYDGTCWESEDGRFYFEVSDMVGKGYIIDGDEKIEVTVGVRWDTLYPYQKIDDEIVHQYPGWRVVTFSGDRFRVRINDEDDGLFALGESLTFYRVDTPSQTE